MLRQEGLGFEAASASLHVERVSPTNGDKDSGRAWVSVLDPSVQERRMPMKHQQLSNHWAGPSSMGQRLVST